VSAIGTFRTNRAGLMMSVVRVDRKWLAEGQSDAIDPYATYAPLPVLVEFDLKNGSLDKPAQSELGSA
jgi:hypothetical protein